MIIITVLVIFLVVGIILCKFGNYDVEFIGIGIVMLSGFLLFSGIITLPINRIENKADIMKFHQTRSTIADARDRNNDFENAALQQKIIDMNQWLASTQYYNSTLLDIWILDEVDQLEPLE